MRAESKVMNTKGSMYGWGGTPLTVNNTKLFRSFDG